MLYLLLYSFLNILCTLVFLLICYFSKNIFMHNYFQSLMCQRFFFKKGSWCTQLKQTNPENTPKERPKNILMILFFNILWINLDTISSIFVFMFNICGCNVTFQNGLFLYHVLHCFFSVLICNILVLCSNIYL